MNYVDTHCHLHDTEFFQPEEAAVVLAGAIKKVNKILCVATSLKDSLRAVEFAEAHPKNCWASIGIHPHEAVKLSDTQIKDQVGQLAQLAKNKKVIAVGECGFDFYYHKREAALSLQQLLLEQQLQLAVDYSLPVSFHVRDAFKEFWPVFDNFKGLRGVLHSFTDTQAHLDEALKRDLYIGVNGISTFTKLDWQQQLFAHIPLKNIVVETDTPFLTPKPLRGNINSPKNVIYITKFLAELRGEDELLIQQSTTTNAQRLLGW